MQNEDAKGNEVTTTSYIISLELEVKTTKNLCFHCNRLCSLHSPPIPLQELSKDSKRHTAYQSWDPNAETQRSNLNETFEKTVFRGKIVPWIFLTYRQRRSSNDSALSKYKPNIFLNVCEGGQLKGHACRLRIRELLLPLVKPAQI